MTGKSFSTLTDTASRLTSLHNDMNGTADDQSLTFTHNPAGQISTGINSNPAYNWDGAGIASEDYSVNGLNQAVQARAFLVPFEPEICS